MTCPACMTDARDCICETCTACGATVRYGEAVYSPEPYCEDCALEAADAAIAAHDCDLGPDHCPECDALWGARADAHPA